MKTKKQFWFCVTKDDLELPCTPVFESKRELIKYLFTINSKSKIVHVSAEEYDERGWE